MSRFEERTNISHFSKMSLSLSRFEDGTDINSPDSNDSGIQSDTRSDDGVSHVRGPVNEDIYAVVNKKGQKGIASPDTPDSVYEVRVSLSLLQALPVSWRVGLAC